MREGHGEDSGRISQDLTKWYVIDIYKILLNTLENPTKLSIVLLLSHRDKMTVTQMSKVVRVSRANLYHFVGQMVKDGLLSKPEAIVKKNYVEKLPFRREIL
jgi:DNA-binding MarR family transcriptional regulator